MIVTNQLITQVHLVPSITTVMLAWDRLRWYRSQTGPNGLYEPATSDVATPAVLRGIQGSRVLAGKQLRLRLHGMETVEVVFTGTDPVSANQAAAQIGAASALLNASAVDNLLKLETVLTGTSASIEVLVDSDAAPSLGLLIGEGAAGQAADTALDLQKSEYQFSDHQSGVGAWYRVAYRNALTESMSPMSVAFVSRNPTSVPLSQLIGCYVRLCDLAGRPLPGRRIFLHNVFRPNRVAADGRAWGVFRQYEELVTDVSGYAETLLLRGAEIDVTIGGTGFTRRVTLPTSGTIVDLLDPALNPQDEFGLQKPDIDFAIRTTT